SRILRHTSHPLIPGIMTSSTTRSGSSRQALSQASSPSFASITRYPLPRKWLATSASVLGSSSATRPRGLSLFANERVWRLADGLGSSCEMRERRGRDRLEPRELELHHPASRRANRGR